MPPVLFRQAFAIDTPAVFHYFISRTGNVLARMMVHEYVRKESSAPWRRDDR